MTQQSPVLVSRSGYVTTITINRPEQRNCLNRETIEKLSKAFHDLVSDPAVRCAVLRSSGTEAFCAGADLRELIDNPLPDARRALFNSVAKLVEAVHRCPVPVIAAVRGFALAGGCGLAAACDMTIAGTDAIFGLPEVGIGLAPMVVLAPISRVVNQKTLSAMVLTGQRITAEDAFRAGLVTRVISNDNFDSEIERTCSELCKQSPDALRASKAAIIDVAEKEYFSFLRELADRSALVSLGSEAIEGLKAFSEKRPPTWRS